MASFNQLLKQLRDKRSSASRELTRLDEAIAALEQLGGSAGRGAGKRGRKRRTMSAAARRKIAAAQRARWARVRQGRRQEKTAA